MTEPDPYRLSHDVPSVADYLRLRREAGLSAFSEAAAARGLPASLCGVSVALAATGEVVGMGRIVGDGGCFAQVTDMAVLPAHQGRGLGGRIMAALVGWAKAELPATLYLSLLADVPADRLYARHGFAPTAPRSVGMAMKLA